MEPVVPSMIGPQRPKFVLFGSSIVQLSFSEDGWGSILADKYARKADVILRGYAGWNSRRALQILHQVFPKNSHIQPSLVILYFGGNDSMALVPPPRGPGPHVPLPEYLTNMTTIISYIQGLSSTTRIICLSTPPVNEYQVKDVSGPDIAAIRTNELGKKYSDALIKLCTDMKVPVIDMFALIQSKPGWWRTYFFDGMHFTGDGSQVVADEILKVLKDADWMPHLHFDYLPIEFDGKDISGLPNTTTQRPNENANGPRSAL